MLYVERRIRSAFLFYTLENKTPLSDRGKEQLGDS